MVLNRAGVFHCGWRPAESGVLPVCASGGLVAIKPDPILVSYGVLFPPILMEAGVL
jgi:hypothetical protein